MAPLPVLVLLVLAAALEVHMLAISLVLPLLIVGNFGVIPVVIVVVFGVVNADARRTSREKEHSQESSGNED